MLVKVYLSIVKQLSFFKPIYFSLGILMQNQIEMCLILPAREITECRQSISSLPLIYTILYVLFPPSSHVLYFRIDLFLMERLLLQNVIKSEIHDLTRSDHAPVSFTVRGTCTGSTLNLCRNNIHLLSQPLNMTSPKLYIVIKCSYCCRPLYIVKLIQSTYP